MARTATLEDTLAIFDDQGTFYSLRLGELRPDRVNPQQATQILAQHLSKFARPKDPHTLAMYRKLRGDQV